MKIKPVEFDGEVYCLVKDKTQSGTDYVYLRKVHSISGTKQIRHNGKNIIIERGGTND